MKLLDFIPRNTPGYHAPFHLARLCAALDDIPTTQHRRIFWCSPRSGVTETLRACMALHPELTFLYAASHHNLTDRVIAGLANAKPADRFVAGCQVTGAVFLDGYAADRQHLEYAITRTVGNASFIILANEASFGQSPSGEMRQYAREFGFPSGYA
jgi:hypothetical protein